MVMSPLFTIVAVDPRREGLSPPDCLWESHSVIQYIFVPSSNTKPDGFSNEIKTNT